MSYRQHLFAAVSGAKAMLQRQNAARHIPMALFAFLTLAIMGPLLVRGYLLHYDIVFGPQMNLNWQALRQGSELYHVVPRYMLLSALGFLLPMDIVQKLTLLGVLFLAMYGMYQAAPASSRIARFTAGLFYGLNPFVYDRFMAGHWLFLLGYALTPFVLRAFYRLLREPSKDRLYKAILWWSLVSLISLHHIILLGMPFAVMALFFIRDKRSLLYALGLIGGVTSLNSWWIMPLFIQPNISQSFGVDLFYAFATRTDLRYGLLFNMLALQGFWYNGWQSIKDLFELWPALVVVWLAPVLASLGLMKKYTPTNRRLALALIVISVLALVLAAGSAPATVGVNSWLFAHIPGLIAMREPQKFLALLALAYAVWLGLGLDILDRLHQKRLLYLVSSVSIVGILLMSTPLFWGGNGQLQVSHYPQSWHRFYHHLKSNDEDSKVVVLPWDIYIEDSFAGELVAHPGRQFYNNYAIVSPHMRLSGVQDWVPPQAKNIDTAIENQDPHALARAMRRVDARYVLLANSRKSQEYAWVKKLPQSQIFIDDTDLLVLMLTSD